MAAAVVSVGSGGAVHDVSGARGLEAWERLHVAAMSTEAAAAAMQTGGLLLPGAGVLPATLPDDVSAASASDGGTLVVAWATAHVEDVLRRHVAPRFWSVFEGLGQWPASDGDGGDDEAVDEDGDDPMTGGGQQQRAVPPDELLQALVDAVDTLHAQVATLRPFHDLFSVLPAAGPSQAFRCLLRAHLCAATSPGFRAHVKSIFRCAFAVFRKRKREERKSSRTEAAGGQGEAAGAGQEDHDEHNEHDSEEDHDDGSEDEDEDEDPSPEEKVASELDEEAAEALLSRFQQLNARLDDLGLLDLLAAEQFGSILYNAIDTHVKRSCADRFEDPCLATLLAWLETVLVQWMHLALGKKSPLIESWLERLRYHCYKTLATLRIGELFDVIVDFPDSQPAVDDLRECILKTDQRGELVSSLRQALQKRLLHPGANTADIITQYISAIKTLRSLDRSGVMLDRVCAPVRDYLRSRSDTIRCIVTSLTDESANSELFEELAIGNAPIEDGDAVDDDADWVPEAVEVNPSAAERTQQKGDITSLLVNLYGSKELFVSEYHALLAERLLGNLNFDTDREVRNLELLKIRFGEEHMHTCEVMLKDIADSKRINTLIRQEKADVTLALGEECQLNVFVLSRLFWPSIRDEKLQLIEPMEGSLKAFQEHFEVLKAARTLDYKPTLGSVELEIELKDRTLELTVSPVHATIIQHFEQQETWTLADLSSAMQMPAGTVRKRLSYWLQLGLICESDADVFVLDEESKGSDPSSHHEHEHDASFGADGEEADQEKQSEAEQKLWLFLRNMLGSLGETPFARILTTLSMFGEFDMTEPKLRKFLDAKVAEDLLTTNAGSYRLAPS